MNRQALRIARAMLALPCAAAMLIGGAAAGAAEVTYQHESGQEWKAQLAAGQIATVTINKRERSLRTTLKDGRYVLATYAAKGRPQVEAEMKARHVPFTVLSKTQALALEKKKTVHHKLRYIAGGIVLGIIVIVGGVLLVRRRRGGLD
jgi:hypothetical protein